MVHIKKVEIYGFKSFGFKNTIVEFRPGLVTVSGPNGSGKSNILDAIIFAMGENRPKVMRADKLRSLIHDIDGQHRGTKITRSIVHFDNVDRKIPINSDTVEIAREMDSKGDNTYYINKKKSQRNSVINLLDAANAGLNQLNALQQGTVTKISELSSEEKRKSIEDLVGLSYFDEKKEEAQKNLEEADHRLEIALTRMDEVKKNIDNLEEARNIFLRRKVIEVEIGRLNAIDAAHNLKIVNAEIAQKKTESDELANQMRQNRIVRDELDIEIKKIETEKTNFLTEVEEHNHKKAEVDSKIIELINKQHESHAAVSVASKHIAQIISRLPKIDEDLRIAGNENKTLSDDSISLQNLLDQISTRKTDITKKLDANKAELTAMIRANAELTARITSKDNQNKKLTDDRFSATLTISKLETQLTDSDARFSSNHSKKVAITTNITNLKGISARLERLIMGHNSSLKSLQSQMSALDAKRTKIQKGIDDLNEILEKSQNAASQYDAKLKTIRNIMHEDYSIARLRANAHEIGIEGFAYEILSWDPKYERAVLAAGSEWLKAIVTKDIATMVSLSEYARSKHLPKLKIISLGGISKLNSTYTGSGYARLADHVKCTDVYKPLATFLFGDVIIARTIKEAHKLAADGHRVVTLDGELVEPGITATVIDTNSKISKLTRIIANSTTLDDLLHSIGLLKEYVGKKRVSRSHVNVALNNAHRELAACESSIATSQSELDHLIGQLNKAQATYQLLDTQNTKISKNKEYAINEIQRLDYTIKTLDEKLQDAKVETNEADAENTLKTINALSASKTSLESEIDQVRSEYDNASSRILKTKSDLERNTERTNTLNVERDRLVKERVILDERVIEQTRLRDTSSEEITTIRQKEHEIISTNKASISHVNDYDSQLNKLQSRSRTVEREISNATRANDSLRRDLGDLTSREGQLKRVCELHEIGTDIDDINVRELLHALRAELDSTTSFNSASPADYQDISTSYRSMSSKKNALESERNKIISFIEGIEKDKRQKFLDAFNIVNTEIRHVFTKMTGGNAELELQDEDDIFNSGISYMVQFANKPKRESASISGGEKSLAAIVFVLGLQKLNPSPFYLFDEVDAHLDAPNSEKLARILTERAATSQFITVSLKDSIIKRANLVYGVYPKNGVSQVLVYKDKQAQAIAN